MIELDHVPEIDPQHARALAERRPRRVHGHGIVAKVGQPQVLE
jgi:hypothetical protein